MGSGERYLPGGEHRCIVRIPRQGEGRRMAEIYREAFGPLSPSRPLRPTFLNDRSLVAVQDDEIAGLLCVEMADESLDAMLGCLEPLTRSLLAPIRAALPPDETAAVEIIAPTGLALVSGPRDLVITAIAVDRRYRRRGVGRALAEVGTLGPARGRQIFAHCVAGSGSRELFEGIGFTPLVHFARHYADGTAMTLLYRPALSG